MANKVEVMIVLTRLMDAYDHTMPEKQVEVYTSELAKFDRVRIYNAATAWIQENKFFPRLAELIGKMRQQDRANEGLTHYPQVLPQEKRDRELIWRMCVRNITDPNLLTAADLAAAPDEPVVA